MNISDLLHLGFVLILLGIHLCHFIVDPRGFLLAMVVMPAVVVGTIMGLLGVAVFIYTH